MDKVPELDRFITKIRKDKVSGCWIWVGANNIHRYGSFCFQGKVMKATRVSYMIFVGEIPEKLFVLHHCDNPSCVNPDHLFLGSQDDNMKDMVKKGRSLHRFGSDNPNSRLSEEDVWWIHNLYERRLFNQVELAELFDVTQGMISSILRGDSWVYMYERHS